MKNLGGLRNYSVATHHMTTDEILDKIQFWDTQTAQTMLKIFYVFDNILLSKTTEHQMFSLLAPGTIISCWKSSFYRLRRTITTLNIANIKPQTHTHTHGKLMIIFLRIWWTNATFCWNVKLNVFHLFSLNRHFLTHSHLPSPLQAAADSSCIWRTKATWRWRCLRRPLRATRPGTACAHRRPWRETLASCVCCRASRRAETPRSCSSPRYCPPPDSASSTRRASSQSDRRTGTCP